MSDKLYCDCDDDTCECVGCAVTGAADEPVESVRIGTVSTQTKPIDADDPNQSIFGPVLCWDDKPTEMDLSDVGPRTWPMWTPDTSPETAAEIVRRVHDKKWVAKFVALLGGG